MIVNNGDVEEVPDEEEDKEVEEDKEDEGVIEFTETEVFVANAEDWPPRLDEMITGS